MTRMPSRITLGLALLAASSAAAVDPIVAGNLQAVSVDGVPSGAYPSASSHFYPQCVATLFTLSRATRLSTLTFWGSSDNAVFAGANNVKGFVIRFDTPTFSTPALQFSVLRGPSIQETGTSRVNAYGGLEYQYRVNVPGKLPKGTWWMHVGATLNDGANGDAWLWSPGVIEGIRFTQYSGSAWSAWTSTKSYSVAYELRGALACPCDLDDSGSVDLGDIALLLLDYGACPGCAADVDGNGMVDFGDVAITLLETGPCP